MQLNGTSGPTMAAASEPPEPPPRNPDRINASLNNKLSDTTKTKSLDIATTTAGNQDRPVNNNKPLLKPILSLDNNSSIVTTMSANITSGVNLAATSGLLNNKRIELNNQNASKVTTNNSFTTAGTPTGAVNDNGQKLAISSSSSSDSNHRFSDGHEATSTTATTFINGAVAARSNESNGQHGTIATTGQQNAIKSPSSIERIAGEGTSSIDKSNANDVQLFLLTGISSSSATNHNHQTTTLNGQLSRLSSTLKESQIHSGKSIDIGNLGTTTGSTKNDGNRNDDVRSDFDRNTKDQTQANTTAKLRNENEKLTLEIARLRKLLENSPDGAIGGVDLSDSNSYEAHSTEGGTSRLEIELKAAKIQIAALKSERKKLKTDKTDLLAHVKQLCASLQDKEQELRDFIRNFEQRIRETETNNAKISSERERERWSLLKHARDEAERSLALAQQLNARDIQLQRAQEQLQEARRQLSGCLSDQESLLSFAPLTPPSGLMGHLSGSANPGFTNTICTDRGSCSADSGLRGSSDRESTTGELNLSDGTCENGPCITVDADSISLVSSQHMYQYGTPKERSPTLSPLNSAAYSRSVEQLGSPGDPEGPSALTRKFPAKTPLTGTLGNRAGRGGTWGSISRVFARSRNKNKTLPPDSVEITDFSWTPLSEEGYAEKLRLLREASTIPMERWRASQVLAWLEVALGMPQYSTRCSENVKSGKVLLELNDTELETGLGLTHPMHRKKLRLAIEEQRRPELIRYATIGQLGHTWVASEWLPDIGLPQYAETFIHSLVDARMLDTLSKKELEKFLGVTRKFHQASIVHGIHVLRIVKYDRQTLAMRRLQSENVDQDPIVWTNQRFVRWARSIDLGEYADNLKDSGVQGGLVVLEPSFSGDTMASVLGIPPSKNIIRRHLSTEFEALVLPARATLGQGIRSGCGVVLPITGPGGLQQHYATADRRSSGSLRGSLSKTFRFHTKSRAEKSFGSSTSPTPSYSSSEGGGIYATIGPGFLPPPTTAPPPPPPSHRVSAPPAAPDSSISSTGSLPRYAQHRRVKSINDIEVIAATSI